MNQCKLSSHPCRISSRPCCLLYAQSKRKKLHLLIYGCGQSTPLPPSLARHAIKHFLHTICEQINLWPKLPGNVLSVIPPEVKGLRSLVTLNLRSNMVWWHHHYQTHSPTHSLTHYCRHFDHNVLSPPNQTDHHSGSGNILSSKSETHWPLRQPHQSGVTA